jgi:uncharacterized ubiquitin-like protein YukD
MLGDGNTVRVRVQVIDLNSFTLDLQLPTYLPAKDLTARVARDAGLEAYGDDGRRRTYWLRARGRLIGPDEKLEDVGVVDGELVYLLPEPPPGSGVVEQVPDYPVTQGYAGKGMGTVIASLVGVILWAVAWGGALVVVQSPWTVVMPGIGLGLLCISLARHMWGGQGMRLRILLTGLGLYLPLFALVFLPVILGGEPAALVYRESLSGMFAGLIAVVLGWAAWWGAVEPLPTRLQATSQEEAQPAEAHACGICALPVQLDYRKDCVHGCGRVFHSGCHDTRMAVNRPDPRVCAICEARVG